MVHIKRVEMFGFKSFGFKNTAVDFRPGLVSISGPNGSGKSNILDAIIFALGENRPRIMRAGKLKSLIHDIDAQRRGPRLARVSVHFENSDRKIPVGADAVEITREMDDKGENVYYLNRKKTQRGHILNLLEVAHATINELNALKQGTVTQISELSPEDKRRIIEDTIGLSQFDEKKQESLKQLGEADHRLEIALTKMIEVKKYIDDLEEQRNVYLRYEALRSEVGRLEAISAASRLREVRLEKASKVSRAADAEAQISSKRAAKKEIDDESAGLEAEKASFMERADAYSRAKAEVDTGISAAYDESERLGSELAAVKRRAEQLAARRPDAGHELRTARAELESASEKIDAERASLDKIGEQKSAAVARVGEIDAQRRDVLAKQSKIAAGKAAADREAGRLVSERDEARLELGRTRSAIEDIDARSAKNSERRAAIVAEAEKLAGSNARLVREASEHERSAGALRSSLAALRARERRLRREADEAASTLEMSEKAGVQYKAKIKTIKSVMHEDYSLAKLKANARRLGIEGLAYELLSWDKEYERAILAANSDWLKAIVVGDIATLVSLSEYARSKRLPKMRIVSLEGARAARKEAPEGSECMLSERVRCAERHAPLASALFGDVALARSRDAARALAAAGHRAVTRDGEFFESTAAVLDIDSRISDLTRIISESATVEDLFKAIGLLRSYLADRKKRLAADEARIGAQSEELALHQARFERARGAQNDLRSQMSVASSAVSMIDAQNASLASKRSELLSAAGRLESDVGDLEARIAETRGGQDAGDDGCAAELGALNEQKAAEESRLTQIMDSMRESSSSLASLEVLSARAGADAKRLDSEIASIDSESASLEARGAELESRKAECEARLSSMREREQDVISTAGDSMSRIKDFDARLSELVGRERALGREIGALERQTDSVRRDIAELESEEASLARACAAHGLSPAEAPAGLATALRALRAELDAASAVNAGAPAKYLEVSGGYRDTSARKNELEAERNSIVAFIEGIERDKKQTFLDAFDIVEREIRSVFSKMTGGSAWIEIQDEDNIFESGILYMIQFPNKQKRDVESMSGGEKSLAAIVFVLALQKLNPSPFYLFDEADAHLDEQNAERLSKIMAERAADSQFISVSLKTSVIKKAGLVYGVYPKGGVSHVVNYSDRELVAGNIADPKGA